MRSKGGSGERSVKVLGRQACGQNKWQFPLGNPLDDAIMKTIYLIPSNGCGRPMDFCHLYIKHSSSG